MLPIPRRRPSLAVVLASAALGVALVGTVTSTDAAPKKSSGTVVLEVGKPVTIEPGNLAEGKANCPRGYSIIAGSYNIGGESAYAHAADVSIQSRGDSYAVVVVNPPANPVLPGSGRPATLTVAANCAKTGQPIVPVTPYKQR